MHFPQFQHWFIRQEIEEMIADRRLIMQESHLGRKLDCHSCKAPSFV